MTGPPFTVQELAGWWALNIRRHPFPSVKVAQLLLDGLELARQHHMATLVPMSTEALARREAQKLRVDAGTHFLAVLDERAANFKSFPAWGSVGLVPGLTADVPDAASQLRQLAAAIRRMESLWAGPLPIDFGKRRSQISWHLCTVSIAIFTIEVLYRDCHLSGKVNGNTPLSRFFSWSTIRITGHSGLRADQMFTAFRHALLPSHVAAIIGKGRL